MSFTAVLEEKMTNIVSVFDKLTEELNKKREEAEAINKEMNSIVDEQKRLQGEYRVLKELIEKSETAEGNVAK